MPTKNSAELREQFDNMIDEIRTEAYEAGREDTSYVPSYSADDFAELAEAHTAAQVAAARRDELDEAFIRNAPAFVDEIDLEKYWNNYYEKRLAHLTTGQKEQE